MILVSLLLLGFVNSLYSISCLLAGPPVTVSLVARSGAICRTHGLGASSRQPFYLYICIYLYLYMYRCCQFELTKFKYIQNKANKIQNIQSPKMSVQNPNTFQQANLDKNNPNLYQTNVSLQQGQQPAGRVPYASTNMGSQVGATNNLYTTGQYVSAGSVSGGYPVRVPGNVSVVSGVPGNVSVVSGVPGNVSVVSGVPGPTLNTSTIPVSTQYRPVSYVPGGITGSRVNTVIGGGSQVRGTIINDNILRSAVKQPVQVYRATGPPLPPLQTSTWRPSQSRVQPVQIQSKYMPTANVTPITKTVDLPPLVQTIYKQKKDQAYERKKPLYQSQGYKEKKRGIDFCLPLLGILGLLGLLVGLYFGIRAINQANQPGPATNSTIAYQGTGKDNSTTITNTTIGPVIPVSPTVNTSNSVTVETTTIITGNTSTPGTVSGSTTTVAGQTVTKVPSSAILLSNYRTDPSWANVSQYIKTSDTKITGDPVAVYALNTGSNIVYYPIYTINGVNYTYAVPVDYSGQVITTTTGTTTNPTGTTTNPSGTTTNPTGTTTTTSWLTRIASTPTQSTPLASPTSDPNFQKLDTYMRTSSPSLNTSTLKSVSTSKSGTVTTYYPTYIVNGKQQIYAIGITDDGMITNPIIQATGTTGTTTGKTLATLTTVPNTATGVNGYTGDVLWAKADAYVRNNDDRIGAAAVVKQVQSIKQADINTYYTTYLANNQQYIYGVAVRDNGQILPIGTQTSTTVPTTSTTLTPTQIQSDPTLQKINQYILTNGNATLGNSPTLQQVQANTINGKTTYYPTYTSTDGNFSVLYETNVDASGNVQIVSVNKKAINVGHHHWQHGRRHRLGANDGHQARFERRHRM